MALKKIIKNMSTGSIDLEGVTLAPGEEFIIPESERDLWRQNTFVVSSILEGTAAIGDGETYFTQPQEGLEYFFRREGAELLGGDNSLYHRTVTNHKGNTNQVLYVDTTGDIKEVPLGPNNYVYSSTGPNTAPVFRDPTEIATAVVDVDFSFSRSSTVKKAYLINVAANGGDFETTPLPRNAKIVGLALHLSGVPNDDQAAIEIYEVDTQNNETLVYTYNVLNTAVHQNEWNSYGCGSTITQGHTLVAYVIDGTVLNNPIITMYIQFVA